VGARFAERAVDGKGGLVGQFHRNRASGLGKGRVRGGERPGGRQLADERGWDRPSQLDQNIRDLDRSSSPKRSTT
jgi:hypothetical protein